MMFLKYTGFIFPHRPISIAQVILYKRFAISCIDSQMDFL